jgi:hypothetical protein
MIIHHHYIKKNSSIQPFASFIIDNFNSRVSLFQQHTGFLGMTTSVSEAEDTLTISLEWTSQEVRQQIINASNPDNLNELLQNYCLENYILISRSITNFR